MLDLYSLFLVLNLSWNDFILSCDCIDVSKFGQIGLHMLDGYVKYQKEKFTITPTRENLT